MLMCVIEFGTVPGQEDRNRALVTELIEEAKTIDGFISKETFLSRDNQGKVITISYWRDEAALTAWMRHERHRQVIPLGRKELFTHYTIQIAEVKREKAWQKPA